MMLFLTLIMRRVSPLLLMARRPASAAKRLVITLNSIEVLIGGTGADHLTGDGNNNTLDGGDGADLLSGGAGDDSLYGGAGVDSLSGGAGNDTVDGGSSHDEALYGGGGDDYLIDEGRSRMWGGCR
jgi:Ca2+-binding RTX toxin-like protein